MKRMHGWCVGVLLCLVGALPAVAQERPYTDGPVTMVTGVKVLDGQYENYMAYLAQNWRRVMEAAKTEGLVTDYHVFNATAHNPQEADLYLVVSYPNMAAFDGIDARMDKITGTILKQDYKQADEASGKRTVMRTLLGQEMLREVMFK